MAARAIAQADLEIWYEVIDPVRAATVDGAPIADDDSNIGINRADRRRMLAHAVSTGGAVPVCVQGGAKQVLPSHHLWALAPFRKIEMCQACTAGVQAPVQVAQIRDQVSGQVAAAAVGGGDRPDAAQQYRGFVRGEVQCRTAGDQVTQQDVQPVEQPDAFAGQIVTAFGQQPQPGVVVLGDDLA